jgi:hypothetical protein
MAGGDFGHDAAVAGVDGSLRGDDVRTKAPAVFDYAGGGLVARRFDAEDEHGVIVAVSGLSLRSQASGFRRSAECRVQSAETE